jgi:solute carrier family 8 (sodium/calcium exchanger)
LRVKRFSGARGKVYVPFKTLEGTAKDEKDFEMTSGHVVFDNNETE